LDNLINELIIDDFTKKYCGADRILVYSVDKVGFYERSGVSASLKRQKADCYACPKSDGENVRIVRFKEKC
jgi:hypothetical protein